MLRSVSIAFLSLVATFGFIKCDSQSKPGLNPSLTGTYKYAGYDTTGNHKIVEGRLQITSVDSKRVRGKWELKAIGNPPNIGPQIGSGDLEGEVTNDSLNLNLNPSMRDNNVSLSGKIEGRRIRGTWSYSGFAGMINQGTFEATKN